VVEKVVTKEVEKVVKETVVVEETVVVQETVPVVVTATPAPMAISCWWGNWGEYYNNLMKAVGDDFTKEAEPNIKVEWTFAEDWQQKLLTSVAAGTPPDTCYMGSEVIYDFAQQGAVLPLDERLAQAGIKGEDFVPAMWDTALFEGKAFGLPGAADAKMIIYSKDVYRDVGLDPEAPPKSLDEFKEHALRCLKKKDDGSIDRIGYNLVYFEMQYFVAQYGGTWYDPATHKVTANSPETVKCYEWMQDYVKQCGFDQMKAWSDANPGVYAENSAFSQGKQGMFIDGFWVYSALDDFAPEADYGVAYFPTLDGSLEGRNNYYTGGWFMGMPVGSKHVEEAWLFLKYGFLDAAWKMGCHTLNGTCVIAQMKQQDDCLLEQIGKDNRYAPYIAYANDTLRTSHKHWPVMLGSNFYRDEWLKATEFVMRGQKSPKEALDGLTEVVQAEVDRLLSL
jgi:multiple sugar transport system substrate-binding protein